MNKKFFIGHCLKSPYVLGAVVIGLSLSTSARAETLKDALTTTYMNNPVLEAQRASLRATDETLNQAKAGWRPSVTASGTAGYKNSETIATFNTSGTTHPKNLRLELQQPLFNGFQTVNGTSEARMQINAARANLRNAEQQVMLQAVTAYMDVIRDVAVLELTANNVMVLRRQLQASEDRFRVGEITRTDVAQSKARLSRAVSEKFSGEATLTSSRSAYQKTVGNAPATLKKPDHLPALPASNEAALSMSIEFNPVLTAARFTQKAAHSNIKKQKGILLPSVNLVARYSKGWQNFSTTDRSTNKEVMAQFSMPLYQSGLNSSRIRQARQIENQRRLEAIAAERLVVEQVRNAWESYREATARITSSQDQVDANGIALEGVRQEAEVGSRTTLDVLDAEQELLDARVSLVRSERDQYVSAYGLLAAIGKLTVTELELDLQQYDPSAHTSDVENQMYGWGIENN